MPKNPNRLPGQIFDNANLQDAKQLIQDIADIINKGFGGSTSGSQRIQQQIADNERLVRLYSDLVNLSSGSIKKVTGDINANNEALKDQLNDINKSIIQYEQQLKIQQQARTQLEVEKQKEILRLEEQKTKLAQNRTKYEKEAEKVGRQVLSDYRKQLEDEFDKKPKSYQLMHNKDTYVTKRFNAFKANYTSKYQSDLDDIYTSALENGTSFTKADIKGASSNASKEAAKKTAEKFEDGADNLKSGSALLKVGASALKSASDMIFGLIKQGINKQYNVYNETYSNVSARTGIDRTTYYNNQIGTRNEIVSRGMLGNVGTAEAMQMWNDLANNGMSQADIMASALDNVITNKIVPYLDTTSEAFNILNTRLDNQFVKDIRGINKANLEIAGNNYMTQEMLQMIIDEVQPMSDEALQNLAQGSAEFTATVNSLRQQGMSEEAAKSYATQLFKNQKYSDQVLRNGSVSEKLGLISNMQTGTNIYNPEDWNNAIGQYVDVTGTLMGGMQGYDSTYGGLLTNIVGSAFGESYDRNWFATTKNKSGTIGTETAANVDKRIQSSYKDATVQALTEFAGDQYQTQKDLQENITQNIATDISVIKEQMGHWSDVVDAILKGIGSLFATWIGGKLVGGVIGKGIGTLAGTAAGGAGSGILGTLTTGLGVVGLTAATIGLLGSAFKGEFDNVSSRESNEISKQLAESSNTTNQAFSTNKAVTSAMGAASAQQQQSDLAQNVTNAFTGLDMMWANMFGSDQIEKNRKYYEWMSSSGVFSEDKDVGAYQRIAAYYLWDKAESLSGLGITRSDLEQIAQSGAFDLRTIQKYANQMVDAGWNPSNKAGQQVGSAIDFAAYGAPEGTYRSGLDYVPYDNYPALLHEGEAVLTASTAGELRTLVDEYRNTNAQSISIDAAIKEQTIALTERMDRIIQALQFSGADTGTPDSKATRNMLSMRNINAFTNN